LRLIPPSAGNHHRYEQTGNSEPMRRRDLSQTG
jgi:hypothetical protein